MKRTILIILLSLISINTFAQFIRDGDTVKTLRPTTDWFKIPKLVWMGTIKDSIDTKKRKDDTTGNTGWTPLWKLGLYSLAHDTTVAWRKMDSVRVNSLLLTKMSAVSLIDSLIWNTVPQKMDSVRVLALREADTVRAVARENLKMTAVSLIDSVNWNTATAKMDSVRVLALRGVDTVRAVAREGLKAPLISPSFTTPNIGAATGTSLAVTGAITSSGAGIGYVSGAGGTQTQSSSRTTGVTLSKLCGTITMYSSAVAAAASSTFTWTNTFIAATDIVIMQHNSTTNASCWHCEVICGAGSATVVVKNISAASITEATPLNFIVIKAPNN